MRPSSLLHAAAIVAVLSLGRAVAQQAAAPPGPGARVRVHAGATYVGTLVSLDSATLAVLRDAAQDTVRLPVSAVRRLDVSRGRSSGALRGAGFGAALGATAGTVLRLAGVLEDCRPGAALCFERELLPLTPALLGAVGAGLGALSGARTARDRWAQVPVRPIEVAVAPLRDRRLGVGVSVGF